MGGGGGARDIKSFLIINVIIKEEEICSYHSKIVLFTGAPFPTQKQYFL